MIQKLKSMEENICLDVIMDINRNMKYMNASEKKEHLDKWSKMRIQIMNEAEEKFGKLNSLNLKEIQNYMKIETNKWKKGLR